MKDKARRILTFALLIGATICIAIAVFSTLDANRDQDNYEQLQSELSEIKEQTPSPPTPEATETPSETAPPEPTNPSLLPLSEEYLKLNPDYCGWISIPGIANDSFSDIDYPVVKVDVEDAENPYLHEDFSHNESRNGTIYASSESENPMILFGHHMKTGVMFSGLERFKNPEFRESHREIYFTDLYAKRTFEVVAVYCFEISDDLNNDGSINYADFYGTKDPLAFLEFLKEYKGTFYLNETVVADASSQFLALQTCTYSGVSGEWVENARLAILAIEVSE